MSGKIDDVITKVVAQALHEAPYNAKDKSIEHVIHDRELPAFVRATIMLMDLPATETMLLEQANMLPALYARCNGKPCRVTIVSRMGDIGIAFTDRSHGYNTRGLSVYDLTNFSQEKPADLPPEKRR